MYNSFIPDKFNDGRFTLKSSLVNLSLQIFTLKSSLINSELAHRKGGGTCRSPKSYNRSLDCPSCLVLFKMEDKISMSQRALPKVTIHLKSAIYP